jgi:hypothetical protein
VVCPGLFVLPTVDRKLISTKIIAHQQHTEIKNTPLETISKGVFWLVRGLWAILGLNQ